MVVLGAWLLFRFVSDWPRGAAASGIGVPESWLQVSYYGLILWIVIALIFLFMMGRFGEVIAGDPIARAHLFFIGYQFIGLFIIARDFGNDGLLAGVYILVVSMTFLIAYVLGVRIGRYIGSGDTREASKRSLEWLVWCMAPCLAVGALQLLTGSGRDVGGIPRIYGGTSSPNVLGALLLVFIGLQLWSGEPRLNNFRRILLGVTIALFVACFSLSGIVAISFMFCIFWLMSAFKAGKIRVRISWVVGGALALALIAYFADAILAERFGELQQSDNSLTWRTRTWSSYLDLLRDTQFFLLGGGLGFDHLGLDQEPHNEWLRVLLEAGVIGVLLFVRIWWILVRGLREIASLPEPVLQRRGIGMIAIVAGLALWACVDSVLRTAPSALLIWTAAGTLIGAARTFYASALAHACAIRAQPPARQAAVSAATLHANAR